MRCFVRAAIGALAFATVATGSAAAQSGPKIAYINSQKILAQAPGRAAAEAKLKQEADGLRAQVQSMQDSLNSMIQAYTKDQPKLSDSVQATREAAIRAKQSAYQQRTQQLQQQAQQRESELIGPIMQQIDSVIEKVRAEGGYALVFDANAQGGAIVAADSSLDITDAVIARLKSPTAKGPSKPGKSDPPSGIKSSRAGVKGPDGPTGPR
jgi:outer membrane protein